MENVMTFDQFETAWMSLSVIVILIRIYLYSII